MEFLKALFGDGESLTYEQLQEKVKEAKFNVVNIADGSYVSRAKFDDTANRLNKQVTGLQEQLTQRDADMNDLNNKLTAAQADTGKLTEAQDALKALQSKYDTDKQAWEANNAKQAYEFAVKTAAGKLHFSSAAAQRDFVRGAIDAGFKMDGETIIGFSDYVEKYKTDDPTAFVQEQATPPETPPPDETPAPSIVLPKSGGGTPDTNEFNFGFHSVRPKPTD